MRFRGAGFTLIELLVVISIIAVLATMLFAGIQLITGLAKKSWCASNLRQVGVGVQAFAADNEGRGPGRGIKSGASYDWVNVLNEEIFGQTMVPRMNTIYQAKLGCPEFTKVVSNRRPFAYSINAAGGAKPPAVPPPPDPDLGIYAEAVIPASSRGPLFTKYALGAHFGRFTQASTKIIIREHERASDEAGPIWPNRSMDVNDDASSPEHCANSGFFAFRHRGLTMNLLYGDMHVASSRPVGDLNDTAAYSYP